MALCLSVFSESGDSVVPKYPDSKKTKDQEDRFTYLKRIYQDVEFFLFQLVPVNSIDSLGLTRALEKFSRTMLLKAIILAKHLAKSRKSEVSKSNSIVLYADEGSTGSLKEPLQLPEMTGVNFSIKVEKKAEDKHFEVAAASIIAKFFRDVYMSDVPQVGYLNHDDAILQIIPFRAQARLNFSNVRKGLTKYYYRKWVQLLQRSGSQKKADGPPR